MFPQVDNLSNAEVSWIPGDYRDSVDHGIAETVGYLKDQIATCPDQGIIIGGYSQGAQVVGDALFQLTQEERDRILGVGLFGDPKYTGAYQANFFSTPVSQPWRRGSASELEFGMLDRRVPYVPKDIELRVTSNCSRYDIICAGWSAANVNFRQVHSGYWQEPVRQSTVELMRIASPHLAAAERAKGGLSSEPGVKAVSAEDKQRKRDILFLMNDNSNL